jgi:hypothetical protein
MRNIVIAAFAVIGLWGCATPESVHRQAANNCQAVGITQKDPQFQTCTQAYTRQHLENRLEQSYHDALNAVPDDRRIRHMQVY